MKGFICLRMAKFVPCTRSPCIEINIKIKLDGGYNFVIKKIKLFFFWHIPHKKEKKRKEKVDHEVGNLIKRPLNKLKSMKCFLDL